MREFIRLVATFALQGLGAYWAVATIPYAVERYDENGAILTGVLVLMIESVCLIMIVGGAKARGKRLSSGFPLKSEDVPPPSSQ